MKNSKNHQYVLETNTFQNYIFIDMEFKGKVYHTPLRERRWVLISQS